MLAQSQDIRPLKSFPARKRRKLTVATAPDKHTGIESRRPSVTPIAPATPAPVATPHQCTSCHRSHPPGGAVLCALCTAPICLICARRCTAAPPPAAESAPPTPRLSDSPTPPATPQLRSALALAPSHTNIAVVAYKEKEERRRKYREDGEPEGGCGRTLCRRCCIENDTTHGSTCLECYGVSIPPSRLTVPSA